MRPFWRLLRIFLTMLAHTLYVGFAARRRPPAARAAFRARRQHVGCRALCRILGVRVVLEGRVPEHRGLLLVSNHFGVLDPLVLSAAIPLAAASKAEVRHWPFLGWVCRTFGVLFVERERRTQTATFVETVQDRLRRGVHVLVFPEGTTNAGRRVQPFKTGAFEAVAGLDGGAVLPLHLDAVAVEGAPAEGAVRDRVVWADPAVPFLRHVWDVLSLRDVEMRVRVGEPLPTAGLGRKELAQAAHARVAALAGTHLPA